MLLGVALGVLLLVIQPVRAQDAPPSLSNAETAFDYDEGRTDPITTYNARDPEGNPIFWTLGGADAADFTIDGGVLRFSMEKFPNGPNYEVPTDRENDEDGSGGALDLQGLQLIHVMERALVTTSTRSQSGSAAAAKMAPPLSGTTMTAMTWAIST